MRSHLYLNHACQLRPSPGGLRPVGRRPSLAAALLVILAAALMSGCEQQLETYYGRRWGASVNGTTALGDMFTAAGFRVMSRSDLTPTVRRTADAIVWFPDTFKMPDPEVREWLEGWLAEEPGRVLVYVGRDYDAAPLYWQKVIPGAPPAKQAELKRRQQNAQSEYDMERRSLPNLADAEWFVVEAKDPKVEGKPLTGEPGWISGINPKQVEFQLRSRLDPAFEADVVLAQGDEAVVTRQRITTEPGGDSTLIVVANASFLVNMGLVNKSHRLLASRMIAEIQSDLTSDHPRVVFLESGEDGPSIGNREASAEPSLFDTPPVDLVLLHLALLGVIFCFSRWPIFGRPVEESTTYEADFGRHVIAMGELLERTGDVHYALDRVERYHHWMHPDRAGHTDEVGRLKQPPPPDTGAR